MEKLLEIWNLTLFHLGSYPITVGQLVWVPLLLIIGIWVIKRFANKLSSRLIQRGTDPDLVHLIRRLFYILATIILLVTVLDLINVPITAFAFVSGAVAIGVGFGAQNILNNFISGWILMWERPIRIGDFLEVENTKGTVEQINTRSTRIRRVDGVHMLIPNSTLLENTVVNWTLVDRLIRTSVRVGVAYGSPCRKVAELIEQATSIQDGVLKDPKPLVLFEDFGDSALIFDVYFWINSTAERDLRVIRSNIRFTIDELFAQHQIVIAFPQRDIHVDGSLLIKQN